MASAVADRRRLFHGVALVSNTATIGILITLFSTIGLRTPLWYIDGLTFCYGFFSSLQFTSMNTLVYADVGKEQTSNASSDVDELRCRRGLSGHRNFFCKIAPTSLPRK
jgi:hypothetical protein